MVTLALVGTGRWGTNIRNTLKSLSAGQAGLPECKLKYVVAADDKELAALDGEYTTYTDATKLLAHDDIDGVLIATPGSTHAAIALPFIEKGITTYIEKPMTTSLADALTLQEAAKKSGALVFVGHVHLYNPAYLKARALAQAGGPIRYLYFEGTNNGPFRHDMSAMWDWAPHDVYLALDLMREMPTQVQAWGLSLLRPQTTLYDTTVIKMTFANGTAAIAFTSWLLPKKQKKATIVGTQDTVVFDDAADKKVILYRGMGPEVMGTTVTKREPEVVYPDYDSALALTQELQAFVSGIQTKSPPVTGLEQGLAVVTILDAAERSIANNGALISL